MSVVSRYLVNSVLFPKKTYSSLNFSASLQKPIGYFICFFSVEKSWFSLFLLACELC